MQSNATQPQEYIDSLPEDRKGAMTALRNSILTNLPAGFVEEMSYGMLGYVVPHSIYPAGYHCDPKLPLPFMTTTSFKPRDHFPLNTVAPTELEQVWRLQRIRGDVHDPGAAMFGGVAGHAGLFSNAYDLAKLYQMLLNGGEIDGKRYFKKETIDMFTAYSSDISRRGLGFDKPEKDNMTRHDPYPSLSVSPATFGHTGFTGIGVWADPVHQLLYIFLSNRVTPSAAVNKLQQMDVRGRIQEAVYQALVPVSNEKTITKNQ